MDDDTDRASAARRGTPFLNYAQAAAFLQISRRTLQRMRASSKGPPVRCHARMVLYHIDDLQAWSRSRAKRPVEGAES